MPDAAVPLRACATPAGPGAVLARVCVVDFAPRSWTAEGVARRLAADGVLAASEARYRCWPVGPGSRICPTARARRGLTARSSARCSYLLSKAAKLTDSTGRMTVEVAVRADGTQPPNRLFLRAADTGHGIPLGKLKAVFKPFVQLSSARCPARRLRPRVPSRRSGRRSHRRGAAPSGPRPRRRRCRRIPGLSRCPYRLSGTGLCAAFDDRRPLLAE